ncbi:Protein kinase, partial [Ascosphaera atra]
MSTPADGHSSNGSQAPKPTPYMAANSSTNSPRNPMPSAKEAQEMEQRRRMEEEARRIRQQQATRRQQEGEAANRRVQEEYNASIPKQKVPIAQQELGGGGYGGPAPQAQAPIDFEHRFNPSRPAPQAPVNRKPSTPRTPQQGPPLQAQRPAPSPPVAQSKYAAAGSPTLRTAASNNNLRQQAQHSPQQHHPHSPNGRYPVAAPQGHHQPQRTQTAGGGSPVAPVKPLNVQKQHGAQGSGSSHHHKQPDGVRAAEAALTKKPEPGHGATPRQKDVRMSTMTENEVMDRLRQVVSKHDPTESYSKQRKIGQ